MKRPRKGPTLNQIHEPGRNDIETRPIADIRGPFSAIGRSFYKVQCPFCETTVKCFAWSYAAVGKKCGCGAFLIDNEASHFAVSS